MEWQLQDAKNRLSEVIKLARSQGPQVVTVRGKRTAVILSATDYDALRADRPSLVDDLLGGPTWDEEMIEAVEARAKTPSREPFF